MSTPIVNVVRDRLAVAHSLPLSLLDDPPRVVRTRGRNVDLLADAEAIREVDAELDAELVGCGPLEPLLAVDGVTDVLVNGADDVWIDRGFGLERAAVRFTDDAAVRRLAVRLVMRSGRRVDDAVPYADASLADGSRIHVVLPPLSRRPTISIRVLRRRPLSLANLVERSFMPDDAEQLLRSMVAQHRTILVSGATGAGKTTLMSALLAAVPDTERVVTIEDTAELAVDHPHVVSLVVRPPNVEGAGGVHLHDLVRQALRMRPDRLVVGECRGREVVDLLSALNTGHAGGMASVHANSVESVVDRLVALGAAGGVNVDAVRVLADSALDVLVHVGRAATGNRQMSDIALWHGSDRRIETLWRVGSSRGTP